MHNILSAFVFRDYHTYSYEQANMFKRATSKSKPKQNRSVESTIAQTKQKTDIPTRTQNCIQTSQFEANNVNQLHQLGKAIDKVQKTINEVKTTINGSRHSQGQNSENKKQEKQELLLNVEINNTEINSSNKKSNPHPKGFLKQFKQRLQNRRQQSAKNKFNLQVFRNKLNYKMSHQFQLAI